MIEQSKFVRAINRAIDLDYNTLREETTYGELKDAFYSRNFFKFVFKLIDVLVGIITKGIIRKKTNFDNFDMSSLTQTGIIIALSGLVILTVYIVILKLIKKKVKVGKHEISEFSEEE